MNAQEYWRRRQIEREKKWHDLTTTELKKLAKYYRQSSAEIERDIAALFGKFARENKLPLEEARRLIRGEEFKTWRMTLQDYVRTSQADPKILRELNTLAMRSRINRLEALHARTLMELANLAEKIQSTADEQFARAYLDNYYRNLYDFHTTTGLFTPPNAVDPKRVESVLQTAWSGKNYSSRIWTNTRKLSAELQRTMLNAIHRGSSIQKLSKDLATRMDVAYRNAERLVRTELNAVENRASADAMREAGFDSYQFMATLDRRTCARCGERDGEIFALKDMNQGENAPPLHPRCRCTIVASLGGIDGGKKLAIDSDGKRIRIPSDMNYRDWKAIYIDKTKALAEWQIEFEARRKADEQSPLRQRGRAIIEQLANSSLPLPKANGNISKGLAAGNQSIDFDKGGKSPWLIGNIDPKNATQVKQALNWFESLAVNAPVENALIITKNGDTYHCSGTLNNLESIVELGEKLRGAIVTHNHPVGSVNEYSFSALDRNLFVDFNLKVLRGVDEFFVYELNRNPDFLDSEDDIPEIMEGYSSHLHNIQQARFFKYGYKRWLR